jgi:uncharacterized spore protein YtfJ
VNIGDPIKTTVEEIRKILNIENVVGKTIETDELLMFPITKMGMGFGAGMAQGKGMENMEGGGAGAGGAAGIEPVAVVVVHKGVSGPEGVKVMSLKNPDQISRVIGQIGNAAVEIMNQGSKMMKEKKDKPKKEEKKLEVKAETAMKK